MNLATLLRLLIQTLAMLMATMLVSFAHAAYKPAYTKVRDFTHYHVYADGTARQTMESAIRIDTASGVNHFAEREISYNSTHEDVEVIEAYTLQSDGTKVHLDADKIRTQDDASDGGQVFSDTKVKVMIYPSVQVGSVLYFKAQVRQHTADFPGHFAWSTSYSPFLKYENVEVVITHDPGIALRFAPRGMSGGEEALRPDDITGSIRHRYTFIQAEFVPPEVGVIALADFAPRFAVSSFKNYAEVAQAYQARARPMAEVTPAIEALARSLTNLDLTVEQKSRRLYNWVSKNIRYVAVYVGAGGYVPHNAQTILDNGYGDCKDHVVLLEALLRAVGIDSSPVLINASNSHSLPDLATPYAFDHAITFIPELNLYLDATAQFSPFGLLPEAVVQQPTLITATGSVSRTPAVDASIHYAETHTHLKLGTDGSIKGTSRVQTSGHLEVNSRTAQANYKDKDQETVINSLLSRYLESGRGDMQVPDPKDLEVPWVISASFELDPMVNLPGPSALTIPVGIAPGNIKWISMVPANLNKKFPDGCLTSRYIEHVTLEVPQDIAIQAMPKDLTFQRGSMRYQAEYRRTGNTLNVRRELLLQREQRFCNAADEKNWQALTDAMKRDLRAQVLLR